MTAADTERLYAQLDEATDAHADVIAKGVILRRKVEILIREYAKDYDCNPDATLDYVLGALVDLADDAEGPAYRRKVRLEEEIGAIEERDLRLNSPVTI